MGWEMLFYIVATVLITAALAPNAIRPEPAALKDFDFPQVEEGTARAVIFGDCWSSDWVVLAIGNYRTTAIDKSGGKKG